MSTPSDVVTEIAGRGLRNIRLSFADQHGLLRGKVLAADHIADAFDSGVGITGSLLTKDTGQQYAFDLWQGTGGPTLASIAGARDILMVPDASTFRVLPWADGTGWMQCDLFTVDRQPIELSTRRVCQLAEQRLLDAGFRLRAGLEIEFHLYQRDPSASDPGRSTPVHPGWDLLSDRHSDLIDPVLEPIQRDLDALGLAPRSIEAELGPGQIELTFAPAMGTTVADQAVLVRSAIKQIAHRHGLHATFMSRPGFPDAFPSGWHLHQSLTGPDGAVNLFAPDPESGAGESLSLTGRRYLAGLLRHAAASCLLTTPTVTGYKRYRPNSVAPDRIGWSRQHRGAMLRVIDQPAGSTTRIENRAGDAAANPYLYLASQITAGLDGIQATLEPPPERDSPYDADSGDLLPRSLGDAIEAFDRSSLYREALGSEFVDYLVGLKASEWRRFLSTVTDWEQAEYFELF